MKHFRPELLEPPQNFYARELGILSRPNRRGWASSACPFHKSINHRGRKKSTPFAVRFDSGAFSCLDPTCIASGKANRKGDIVDFVRLRDGLSFKDAAQRLGAWDEAPSPETVRQQEAQDRDRKKRKLAEEMAEDERHHKLMDIRDDLHLFIRFQREACDRLNELNAGADPIIDNEADREWEILALAFSAERRAAFAYRMLSGLEVQHGGE